jgi:hypothetical protein
VNGSSTLCGRCLERPALLPSKLHELVASGKLCRECLTYTYNLSVRAARGAFGPLPFDSPAQQNLILEMELLRIEAALQNPEVSDRDTLDRRWQQLMQERLQQGAAPSALDLDHIKQWLSSELGSG